MPYMTPTAAELVDYSRRFLLISLCILVAACSGKKESTKEKPPVPIRTAVSSIRTIPVQIRVIGNVEAYAVVSIKSQVNGRLEKVHFLEGEDVRRGEPLFTIDSRPFEATLRQAKAALARDLAQERYARAQQRRYGELLKEGIVSRDQYEQLQANADALTETVRADRASVDNAAVMLGYCYIRAPIDGRTGNLMVQGGNLVRANDDPVLVTINRINPIYVAFSVPEKELAEIRKHKAAGDLKVEAFIPSDSGPAEQGVLSFLDNAVDAATGTIRIKGTFQNREKRLWPGQFVDVVLTLSTIPNAVVAPSQAVQTGQDGDYVFVVKPDRTVSYRQVFAGEAQDGVRVIKRGLAAGETVVTDGHLNLVPGAKVVIRQDAAKRQGTR